jgi:hypothetical protein
MVEEFMQFGNWCLFKFIKFYLNDDKFNDNFKFRKEENKYTYVLYGQYGSYGGLTWSTGKDISELDTPLSDNEYINSKPIDPLDTVFMFHDYELNIGTNYWDLFEINKNAMNSVLLLSNKHRYINYLIMTCCIPMILIFTAYLHIYKNEDTVKHNVFKLHEEFLRHLSDYHNGKIGYERLEVLSKNIFDRFINCIQDK